ncbi:MAG: VOC family protein [Alphaproteobacteria bacterium]|nr:VOC family protein [Alphaproteobacteria bacterium]
MAQPIAIDEAGKWTSNFAPAYWAHWVLKSTRRKALVEWYCKVFGARPSFENRQLSFLTWDMEHHRLAIIQMPGIFVLLRGLQRISRKFFGLDHQSFNFGSLANLLHTYERLRELGIKPVWCTNHGPTTSIYYEDPDGNRLEFQIENFDTVAELQAFGQSGAFKKNPIGVNFDPDYLLERLRAGVSETVLKQQGSGTRPGTKEISGYKSLTWRTL